MGLGARGGLGDRVLVRKGKKRTFYAVEVPSPPTSPAVIGWAAGFADGESSLTFRGGTPLVRIANCHLPTLLMLCDWFGGSVCNKDVGPRCRPAFEWCVSGDRARACLELLLPHLLEKREQAEAILGEPKRGRGQAMSDEDRRRREDLTRRLARMKRPVFHPPT